jgi:hypothetical protein
MVRESDMGNLDDLLDLVGCQLAVPLHRKPGRTVKAGSGQENRRTIFNGSTRLAPLKIHRKFTSLCFSNGELKLLAESRQRKEAFCDLISSHETSLGNLAMAKCSGKQFAVR